MDGIRLRSDSTGSAKSAFYQGKIVSNIENDNTGEYATRAESCATLFQRRNKHNRGRRAKKHPPTASREQELHYDYSDWSAGPSTTQNLPISYSDVSPSSFVSPFATPGGYYSRNQQKYHSRGGWLSQVTCPLERGGTSFKSHGTMSIRSGRSLNGDRDANYHSGSSSSWKDDRLVTGKLLPSHRVGGLLDEAPSMDEAELKGVSLELESSPVPSPSKRCSLLHDGGDFVNDGSMAFPPSPPPFSTPSPLYHPGVYHNYQGAHGHLATYGTNEPPGALMQKPRYQLSDSHDLPDLVQEEAKLSVFSVQYFWSLVNRSNWLTSDICAEEDGTQQQGERSSWSVPALVRFVLYNPLYPEFTSLQQFNWAVILGVVMGIFTAVWKTLIEFCVDFVWKSIPEKLLSWGVFSDLDGPFPVYHYMWITPAMFGGVLSYIFAALPTPIPGQNEWIHNLHSRGVQNPDTFGLLFLLSTAGMASGLSLGPELPLILTAGMVGSWLGVLCKQSILSARVLNLTAASAAIGGFFGFPMAGALFVLELPHRMGLQYFEALSPATIASIVAVLTNRLATGNDVTGYYEYPFLNESLPSSIFHDAIIFGLFGGAIGIFYTKVILFLKASVHDIFHMHENDRHDGGKEQDVTHISDSTAETTPLVFEVDNIGMRRDMGACHPSNLTVRRPLELVIAHEPTRAGVVGLIIGITVGITCMFFPHVMFWGESQLQNLIDKGRTPLPVFGQGGEPSAGLVALGYCVVDRKNDEEAKLGFSIGCSAAIGIAKIFVTGLSLGTGIVGGHFWAPLFVGCTASHFLTDTVAAVSKWLGVSTSLSAYPCVAMLCMMGSCHVVTFRAHIAIILILTLTIDAFDPEDGVVGAFRVAGDYSAVFPLLTVAVFVALQISRQFVFYEKQRSRGDIMALPEVLCEPGKEGRPLVMHYDGNLHELDESEYDFEREGDVSGDDNSEDPAVKFRTMDDETTQSDIEAQFNAQIKNTAMGQSVQEWIESPHSGFPARVLSPLPPRPGDKKKKDFLPEEGYVSSIFGGNIDSSSNRATYISPPASNGKTPALEEILDVKIEAEARPPRQTHRRSRSEPFHENYLGSVWTWAKSARERTSCDGTAVSGLRVPVHLKRVSSFGQVDQEQPSLLDQARKRAASFVSADNSSKGLPKVSPSSKAENCKGANV